MHCLRPESPVPSTVSSVDCPVLSCASCEGVEYGTIPVHQVEEAQMSMCCRMHRDMAWLHLFSLEIAHPTIPRDVSTTATKMCSPEAQFRIRFSKSSRSALTCFSSVLIARSAGFA